jgi:hypothetical protein
MYYPGELVQASVTSYLAALLCCMVILICGVLRISRLTYSAYLRPCSLLDVLFVDPLWFCGQQAIREDCRPRLSG